jgi:type II secretory pathway component PulF
LRLPLVGPVRHASATSRAARTLGALLATGAPALAALDAAREAAGDQAIAARLGTARDRVAEGSGMASALGATAALTAPALQLAAIGEGSGRLAELLLRAADLEARDTERRIKALVAFAEPALILAFAALVAFVAAALLQAVYSLRPGGI